MVVQKFVCNQNFYFILDEDIWALEQLLENIILVKLTRVFFEGVSKEISELFWCAFVVLDLHDSILLDY